MPPPELAPGPQWLPPILHSPQSDPILEYSKGPRGLSVLPRVSGIFTTVTVSPDPPLRHRSSRSAIHARQNLPDKELRYLRTVIVTAAVNRGFSSELRRSCPPLTPCFNLPAPSRRQTAYVALKASRSPVLLVSSRLTPFTAAPSSSGPRRASPVGALLLPKLRS